MSHVPCKLQGSRHRPSTSAGNQIVVINVKIIEARKSIHVVNANSPKRLWSENALGRNCHELWMGVGDQL